ncbi:MAG: hypothetical protein ABSA79_05905 [Candidatus Bathyarchaeia archaeon]|jgi:sporulation protein YlmC with PRC-barrel domain
MSKTGKLLTKDALVSMQVIDSKGRLMGKVKDVALEVGKIGISLAVQNDNGEIQIVQWGDIQAASDFIILKPQSQNVTQVQPQEQTQQQTKVEPMTKQKTPPTCSMCGKPLKWIPQYERWYCYKDKIYADQTESSKDEGWKEVFGE